MTLKESGYFNTKDNAKLYYEVHGESGPALVLTYGLACLFNHWHFQVEDFSKDHQVILYDIRGHHKSSSGELSPSIDTLASDAVELSKFLGHKSASFWGHSFGVPISLRIGSLFSDYVDSLILINGFYSNPFNDVASSETLILALDYLKAFAEAAPDLSAWLWRNGIDNRFAQYIAGVTGGFNLERASFKDIEIYSKGVGSIKVPVFCDHFTSLLKFDGSQYFKDTVTKTLIVHGKRDGLIPLEQAETMNKNIENSKLIQYVEGSHCTQLDLPDALNKEIRSFLK